MVHVCIHAKQKYWNNYQCSRMYVLHTIIDKELIVGVFSELALIYSWLLHLLNVLGLIKVNYYILARYINLTISLKLTILYYLLKLLAAALPRQANCEFETSFCGYDRSHASTILFSWQRTKAQTTTLPQQAANGKKHVIQM